MSINLTPPVSHPPAILKTFFHWQRDQQTPVSITDFIPFTFSAGVSSAISRY